MFATTSQIKLVRTQIEADRLPASNLAMCPHYTRQIPKDSIQPLYNGQITGNNSKKYIKHIRAYICKRGKISRIRARASLFVGPRVFIHIRKEREDGSKTANNYTRSPFNLHPFPLHASPHLPRFLNKEVGYVGVFPILECFTLVDRTFAGTLMLLLFSTPLPRNCSYLSSPFHIEQL